MERINVQLMLTKDEHARLKAQAEKEGMPLAVYIKSKVLEDDGFAAAYRSLISRVDELEPGTRFDIKSLFGVAWTMPKGVKLNLGKTYFKQVQEGVITNVKPIGKDSSNVMWYEKI